MSDKVVIIGSCMIDLMCYAEKLPKPGETIHGTSFIIGQGGKGANQCVAASKLGANVSLIARLGNDSFGLEYKKCLENLGVNIDHVILTNDVSTGMAQITVSEKGENHIVIVSGANNQLSCSDILHAKNDILCAKVFLFQFETPLDTTLEALKYIKENNSHALTVVNGAPAVSSPNNQLLTLADIFCVNETEAEQMCDIPVRNKEEAKIALLKLIDMGCNVVIITLGKNGAIFNSKNNKMEIKEVAAEQVTPIDTTGAGDAFLGALAFYLANYSELSLEEQIYRACSVASISVTKKGTQSSYPSKEELPQHLFS